MQTWKHRSEFILQTSGAAVLLQKMDFCRFCVHVSSCTERVAASKNQRSNYSFYVTLDHAR